MTNAFSKHAISFPTALFVPGNAGALNALCPTKLHTPMRWDWTLLPTDCVELILKFADAWQLQFWKDCYFDVWAQQHQACAGPSYPGQPVPPEGWKFANKWDLCMEIDNGAFGLWDKAFRDAILLDLPHPLFWDLDPTGYVLNLSWKTGYLVEEMGDLRWVCLIVEERQYLDGDGLVGRTWECGTAGCHQIARYPACFKFAEQTDAILDFDERMGTNLLDTWSDKLYQALETYKPTTAQVIWSARKCGMEVCLEDHNPWGF